MGECRRFGNSRPKTRGGRGLLDLVYRVRSIGFGGDVEEKDCGVTGAVWNLKGLVGWFACVGTDTTNAPGATGLFDCIASDRAAPRWDGQNVGVWRCRCGRFRCEQGYLIMEGSRDS